MKEVLEVLVIELRPFAKTDTQRPVDNPFTTTPGDQMTAQPSDLYDLLKKLRYDTTAMQAKITDAFNILAELNIQDRPALKCPTCQLPMKGPRTLQEHIHVSHDGPIPEHWAATDRIAFDPVEPPLEKTPASWTKATT